MKKYTACLLFAMLAFASCSKEDAPAPEVPVDYKKELTSNTFSEYSSYFLITNNCYLLPQMIFKYRLREGGTGTCTYVRYEKQTMTESTENISGWTLDQSNNLEITLDDGRKIQYKNISLSGDTVKCSAGRNGGLCFLESDLDKPFDKNSTTYRLTGLKLEKKEAVTFSYVEKATTAELVIKSGNNRSVRKELKYSYTTSYAFYDNTGMHYLYLVVPEGSHSYYHSDSSEKMPFYKDGEYYFYIGSYDSGTRNLTQLENFKEYKVEN